MAPEINPLLIIINENSSDNLIDELSLSDDRVLELQKVLNEAINNFPTITSSMHFVSLAAKSANELAFLCYHLGSFMEWLRKEN